MCEHDNYLWYLGSAYAENVHLFLNASLLGHTDEKTVHRYIMLDSERMRLCPLSLKDTGLEMEVDVYE